MLIQPINSFTLQKSVRNADLLAQRIVKKEAQ